MYNREKTNNHIQHKFILRSRSHILSLFSPIFHFVSPRRSPILSFLHFKGDFVNKCSSSTSLLNFLFLSFSLISSPSLSLAVSHSSGSFGSFSQRVRRARARRDYTAADDLSAGLTYKFAAEVYTPCVCASARPRNTFTAWRSDYTSRAIIMIWSHEAAERAAFYDKSEKYPQARERERERYFYIRARGFA